MFHIIRLTFDLGMAALALYFAWGIYSGYHAATGTTFQRLRAGSSGSATMLRGKFVSIVAAVTANLDTIADALGQPELKGYIDQLIGNPKIVAGIMLGLSLPMIHRRL